MEKNIIAIMYDFDKTLSTTDMQNYSFIPKLGMSKEEFWAEASTLANETGIERILSYMYVMVKECKKRNIPLTEEYLKECGKNIVLNPGVLTWFDRINEYAKKKGFEIEHYLVSSGTLEMVKGCTIYNKFTEAYGCEFIYDESGVAVWPKQAINYTQKTQFFFRIAKGATDIKDDRKVNEKAESLRIPFSNIIYIGDGLTDIACMTLVKGNGGVSIAVFPNDEENEFAHKIKAEGRVNYAVKTDYSKGSAIESAVKLTIDNLKLKLDTEAFQKNN